MSTKSIYRSPNGKQILSDLYDRQLDSLNIQYEEKFVQTRYGTTHMILAGNKDSIPLICLHGGNSNTPDTLKSDLPLLECFRIHSVDIIGHPGLDYFRILGASHEFRSDVHSQDTQDNDDNHQFDQRKSAIVAM